MSKGITRHHAEWLSLLEISGPFLSMPVLLDVFPQGLEEGDPERRRDLRLTYEEWQDNQFGLKPEPAIHHAWIRYVLERTLELPDDVIAEGQAIPPTLKATMAEHGETLRPDLVVVDPSHKRPRLLIQTVPAPQKLDRPLASRHWKASPAMRMMELLHATNVRLGLVTNGEQWMLVDAPRGQTSGFISWYAELWLDEPITLRAFRSLFGVRRFFAVADEETLEAMLARSVEEQHEVTDQLGYQVRRAVEVLVQAIDLADRDTQRDLLANVSQERLYETALTVMMRLVFLFSAEERGLFPLDDELYSQNYAASTLRAQLREAADQFGEEVIERRHDAWCRLLTACRAIHAGIDHDRLRLPAYGGSLFDPDRFPLLEGRSENTTWLTTPADPLPINNRTVLHLLEALQLLQVKVPGGGPAEARRLSFRALDIEQIGHVYEGLLDHTAIRAGGLVLGLTGTRNRNREPEVPIEELEAFLSPQSMQSGRRTERDIDGEHEELSGLSDLGGEQLITYLHDQTGRAANALRNALRAEPEPQRLARLRAACGNDHNLYQRVLPWAGLIRDDDFGEPTVVLPGSVYVTAGVERRATGTHYTPRSLTEPIVQHTLEPLVYIGPARGLPPEEWQLRPPKELLNLKVCDMAMGSGAFLVQTCRYLSERLVEAWETAESKKPQGTQRAQRNNRDRGEKNLSDLRALGGITPITPEGKLTTDPDAAIPANAEDRLALARRLVADRCLYGVDKNPLAVEMAKLSLWLITLDRNRPFTFLDHALKCGDSLVGVDLDQLTFWSLTDTKERVFETESIRTDIEKVVELRRQIASTPVYSIDDQTAKGHLLAKAEAIAHDLKAGADMLVASYFNDLKARERERLRLALLAAFREGANVSPDLARHADLGHLRPFHWPLEFPEVLLDKGRGGFDGFVGNPPFMGGSKITNAFGHAYRDFLVSQVADGAKGKADLCTYFYLRARMLAKSGAVIGFIATNSVAQGDNRRVGLERLLNQGWSIIRAENNIKWPGEAGVTITEFWAFLGGWIGECVADGRPAKRIDAYLAPMMGISQSPHVLAANSGRAFRGTEIKGMGFVLDKEEAEVLLRQDPRNREVIFPYINGADMNRRPDQSPSRMVINFHDWSVEKASQYVPCFRIVTERVKPYRDSIKEQIHEPDYWKHWDKRLDSYGRIANMIKVLARSQVGNMHSMVFLPGGMVYSHKVLVFPFDDYCSFALLQSTIHEAWARKFSGAALRTDMCYSTKNCFDTFPFPLPCDTLIVLGESYYLHRQSIMRELQEGLTSVYNRFHDLDESAADIARLREQHVQMDYAVAAAYGWGDLDLGHDFHETPLGVRYTISELARREVLTRLLELNHQRYEEEVKAGLHDTKKGKGKRTKKPDRGQMELL